MSYVQCPTCDKRIVDKRRYPVEPLTTWLGMSLSQACLTVGLSGSTQKAARCHGLSRQSVETVSARLKIHPSEIWPEVVDHDIEDLTRICHDERCGQPFIPTQKIQKYCSKVCGNRARTREYQRQRYQGNPEYREYKIEASRQYRARSPRLQAAYKRAWRARKREERAA